MSSTTAELVRVIHKGLNSTVLGIEQRFVSTVVAIPSQYEVAMPRQLGIRHHQERESEDTQKLDIICSIIYIKQNIFHPCTCKANMQSHQLFLGLLEKKGNIKDISCSSSGGNRRHRIFSSLVAYSVGLARSLRGRDQTRQIRSPEEGGKVKTL